MPRISLYRENKTNDYVFFDRLVREQFVVGGVGINIHLYLGLNDQDKDEHSSPANNPEYTSESEFHSENSSLRNIQDFLFLENRDRKYQKDVIYLRAHYNLQDWDFDLSQWGLMLNNDTVFLSVHLNTMISTVGRKLMNGDIIEFPHLKDDYPLDDNIEESFKRYYVVQEGTRSAEGFSQTWYPHLFRLKLIQMYDSVEYRDIIGDITGDDPNNQTLKDYMTSYQKHMEINKAIIGEAEQNTPVSGRETSHYWIASRNKDGSLKLVTADDLDILADSEFMTSDSYYGTPECDIEYYLSGDGVPPNGFPVTVTTAFPNDPTKGQYVLRTDYLPNRLYIFNGNKWIHVEDNVEMIITNSSDKMTPQSKLFNNKDKITLSDGTVMNARTSLSKALQIREDED